MIELENLGEVTKQFPYTLVTFQEWHTQRDMLYFLFNHLGVLDTSIVPEKYHDSLRTTLLALYGYKDHVDIFGLRTDLDLGELANNIGIKPANGQWAYIPASANFSVTSAFYCFKTKIELDTFKTKTYLGQEYDILE